MRRLVVALAAAVLLTTSFALVGCGGGGSEELPPAAPVEQAPPSVAAADEVPDLSKLEPNVYEPFPRDEEVMLSDIESRLDARQPMIILFVDRTQNTTDDHEAIIESLQEKYRGLIDLVTFDVSRFVKQGEDGLIIVDEKVNDDPIAMSVARLLSSDHLDIRFTPYTVIVDREGYIIWRHRGLTDDKRLEREIIRATD